MDAALGTETVRRSTVTAIVGACRELLAGRGQPVAVVGTLADVQAEEDAHVTDVVQPILPSGVLPDVEMGTTATI